MFIFSKIFSFSTYKLLCKIYEKEVTKTKCGHVFNSQRTQVLGPALVLFVAKFSDDTRRRRDGRNGRLMDKEVVEEEDGDSRATLISYIKYF